MQLEVNKQGRQIEVQKFGSESCSIGNFTVVLDENRAIFAHVNTPLLGYVWQKNESNIDILPIVAKKPGIEDYNPYFGVGNRKTGEVR